MSRKAESKCSHSNEEKFKMAKITPNKKMKYEQYKVKIQEKKDQKGTDQNA